MAEFQDDKDGRWMIGGVPAERARDYLARFAPWRTEVTFDSGPKASDYETYTPFNQFPLRKLRVVTDAIDGLPSNPAVLDVGFNCGYNSLAMASRFNARVTGIEVFEKHKHVADGMASLLGLNAEFVMESAEEFERPGSFDLILHFGTLYHLPNPLRSVQKTANSLKSGGWFALETVRYLKDPVCARWVYGYNGDKTNFWALGDTVVEEFFEQCGLDKPRLLFNANVAVYKGEMSRAIWIARKP